MSALSTLPLPLLAFLAIGGVAVLAVAGLVLVHRIFWRPQYPGENEVAGFLYAVIGVVYGVLLAFVVLVVWERFNATDQAVTTEAADLVEVFRDTQEFPEPLRTQAQDGLRAYADDVMDREWRSWVINGEVEPHTSPDPLNPVWAVYRRMQPETAVEATDFEHATERLHELERQRHLRHLASEATLPPLFMPVLIVGGVLTIGFSYFLRLESKWAQATMTAVVALLIAGSLFLIYSLNHPFTGLVQVDKEPFRCKHLRSRRLTPFEPVPEDARAVSLFQADG